MQQTKREQSVKISVGTGNVTLLPAYPMHKHKASAARMPGKTHKPARNGMGTEQTASVYGAGTERVRRLLRTRSAPAPYNAFAAH